MSHQRSVSALATAALGAFALCAAVLASQESAQSPDSDNASARASYLCTPAGVAAFDERVHVRCTVGASDPPYTVFYFAVPTSDPANAARYLSVFETAKVTAKNLVVFFDAGDGSGAAFGCGVSDCRPIWGAEIQQ